MKKSISRLAVISGIVIQSMGLAQETSAGEGVIQEQSSNSDTSITQDLVTEPKTFADLTQMHPDGVKKLLLNNNVYGVIIHSMQLYPTFSNTSILHIPGSLLDYFYNPQYWPRDYLKYLPLNLKAIKIDAAGSWKYNLDNKSNLNRLLRFKELVSLDLSGVQLGPDLLSSLHDDVGALDFDLSQLTQFTHLAELNLSHTRGTDDSVQVFDLSPLTQLKNTLTSLTIRQIHIKSYAPLVELENLTSLEISPILDGANYYPYMNNDYYQQGDYIAGTFLSRLAGLKKLTLLNLGHLRVSDEQVAEFQRAVPGCTLIHSRSSYFH